MQIYTASYVLPISSPPIPGGAVAVENGVITAVGPAAALRKTSGAKVTDLPGCVIVPGLVNAHTHLELTHFPAWKVRKDLDYLPKTYVEWIRQVMKIRRALAPGEVELSVREGLRLCIESGTTAVGEILSDFTLAPLYTASPMAGRLFLEAIGQDPVLGDALLERLESSLAALPEGGLLPGISPHTPHTVSEHLFQGIEEISRRLCVPKAIHLSESLEEVAFMFDSSGPIAAEIYPMARWEAYLPGPRHATSASYLDGLGVLGASTLAVHAVHVTPADVALLKQRGVTVVLCPRSNDALNVGRAPHHLLKNAGIPLALGTDSLASNDSLSLWDEMRYLQGSAPDAFSAEELIGMATLGGARALGIEARAGSLQAGKRADFLVYSGCDLLSEKSLYQGILEKGRLEQVYIAGRSLPRPPAPTF
jgi:aminodeoxyfutalosine deaminase